MLWGTNINTNKIQTALKDFLLTYRNPDSDPDAEPYYVSCLRNISQTDEYYLEVDCNHLEAFNP